LETEAKRRKLDEGEDTKMEDAAGKAPEPPTEQEEDAKDDSRKSLSTPVTIEPTDTTLNVVVTLGGKVLMPLTDGGLQYLIAGARANVGIKSGRYSYEVKIVEALNPVEPASGRSTRAPMPRQLVSVGFSTKESPIFLGDTEDSVSFDSEGFFTTEKKRVPCSQRFSRDHAMAVVLNLDAGSPNANTISLFRDGERISKPQPLPECMRGKPLFPHVNFKNVTLQVNFGPVPFVPLPFRCRMLQSAALDDILVVPSSVPKDGKYEVVFPIALPDEGTFDWLDDFLEKNPNYTELSDRRILDWAAKSGLWRPRTQIWKNSNDKPDMTFGIPLMDDNSVRRILNSVIATQPRNYIIMEVKSNLVKEERLEVLRRFNMPQYKKIAHVTMGEPTEDFKEKTYSALLAEKKEQAEIAWKARKADLDKKKTLDAQKKQLEEAKKKIEDEAAKTSETPASAETKEESATPKEADAVMGDAEKKEEAKEETSKEDDKQGAKEEEPKKGEEAQTAEKNEGDEDKMDEDGDEPPVVELTDKEKTQWFKTKSVSDLTTWVLSTNFAKFSLPGDDEGFDSVRYAWHGKEASEEYLKQFILKHKITCRIEDLQPSEWFKTKWGEWQKVLQEWHAKQSEFKESSDPTKLAAKLAAEESKKKEGETKEGEEGEGESAAKDKNADEVEEELDIFSVEDVTKVPGTGEPLFARFTFEDWALLGLRVELDLLVNAFKRDCNDPERKGIHETHLPFYYNKYYRKSFNVKYYGVNTNLELIEMVKDSVTVDSTTMVLKSLLSEDKENFDIFVKLTEENRRDRQRRIDAGEETVRLKFSKPEAAPPQKGGPPAQPPRPYHQPTPGPVGACPQKGCKGGPPQYFTGGNKGAGGTYSAKGMQGKPPAGAQQPFYGNAGGKGAGSTFTGKGPKGTPPPAGGYRPPAAPANYGGNPQYNKRPYGQQGTYGGYGKGGYSK